MYKKPKIGSFLKSINSNKLIAVLIFFFILFVSIYMISHRLWFSPDQFFIFALFGTVFIGRIKTFLQDWVPFIGFYLSYEFLRGVVPYLINKVHILPMINFDKSLFGFIPTIKLQQLLFNPTHLMWYDYVAATLYICHFIIPMLVGYFFWLKDRKFFKKYTIGFLVLSYAAYITYILYPAMPPWMASNLGYIPPIKEVLGVVMSHFMKTTMTLPTVYAFIGADAVAAMPSLHAALPFLVCLYAIKWNKKLGLIFIPYVLGVWFAVIYLGEHYFADVLAGIIYTVIVFVVVENLVPYIKNRIAKNTAIEPVL